MYAAILRDERMPIALRSLSRLSLVARLRNLLLPLLAAAALAGCQDVSEFATAKHMTPVPSGLQRKADAFGMPKRSPILLRIYKEESVLEVWKADKSGQFKLLTDYKICAWSGGLGPKMKEGDRQAPEGFYTVTPGQMNPHSSYFLSFNIGFPNSFDRSLNRTGTHIMVHGDCSSRGCYAMEDKGISEIYALAREAFAGGQRGFQIQAFPFRMTPENMAKHAESEHFEFWKMLKEGSDHFEVTKRTPQVDVCGRKYVFDAKPNAGNFTPTDPCPAYSVEQQIEQLVAAKRDADSAKMDIVIARLQDEKERETRNAEREKALAKFFNPSGDTGTVQVPGTAVVNAAPPAAVLGVTPAQPAAPSGGAAPPAVASIAAPAATGTTSAPSNGLPGVSVSSTGMAAPKAAPAQPAAASEAPSTALGFAETDDSEDGFFSSVAKGSKGLFRRAGSLLN